MNLYSLRGLSFAYGDRTVLDLPSLDIEEGRIYALAGPNGSGKTTLLMLLGMLAAPYRGRILFRGKDPWVPGGAAIAEIRREVGFLFQSPYLFHGTVERNVAYGLAVRKIARQAREDLARRAMELVGLAGYGRRPVRALSGGEAQRAALARALVIDPAVLLLDEPFTGVDAASRTIIARVLMDMNRKAKVTVIFATHDVEQAYHLSDEVIGLQTGRIVPAVLENVFHGEVREREDGLFFDTGRIIVALPREHGETRTVAVPPESILLALAPMETSARNVFTGRIVRVQERNGSVDVTADAGEHLTARITMESYRKMGLHLGQKVTLVFKAESVRVF